MTKKILCVVLSLFMVIPLFAACTKSTNETKSDKLSVVATIFPQYDFTRQIAGDLVDLKMILPVGSEAHAYEATSQDILNIQNSDVFIYVGGEDDAWIEKLLASIDTSNMIIVNMMDVVTPVAEEIVDGMQAGEEETEAEEGAVTEIEYDAHVWTSPINAIKITNAISKALCEKDAKNATTYTTNTEKYVADLTTLDNDFRSLVSSAKRKTFVVADRFPFRYFADEYGLKYYAAFVGCSASSDPSAETIKFLVDKVNKEQIPVIFYLENSTQNVSNTVLASTNAKSMRLHSCHNLSQEDFDNGLTYIDVMRQNLTALGEALN